MTEKKTRKPKAKKETVVLESTTAVATEVAETKTHEPRAKKVDANEGNVKTSRVEEVRLANGSIVSEVTFHEDPRSPDKVYVFATTAPYTLFTRIKTLISKFFA